MSEHRYHRAQDLRHANDTVAFAAAAVLPGSQVLDVGAADGSVASVLASNGCRVTGIEPDPVAADVAREVCDRVLVADIASVDTEELGGPFDAVVLLDVLEHLVDPVGVLRRIRPVIATHGRVVISVPNATHAGVRLALLENRFDYQDTGLLDRTHLRFFDHAGFVDLLVEGGYRIVHEGAIWREPWQTELGGGATLERVAGLAERFADDPHATTYQFLAVAVRSDGEDQADVGLEPALVFRERAADLEREVQRLSGEVQRLSEIQRLGGEAGRADLAGD